jgi:hypothetical protein
MPVAALGCKLQQTRPLKCKPNHTQAFGRPEKPLASDAGLRNAHEVLVLIRNLASCCEFQPVMGTLQARHTRQYHLLGTGYRSLQADIS